MSLRLPWRFLRGGMVRAGLTVVALACGVAMVCAIHLVNRAALGAFTEVIDTMAGRAALAITAGEDGFFPESTARTVAAVPGVELVVPVVAARAFTADDTGTLVTIHGVDVTDDRVLGVYDVHDGGDAAIDDPLLFVSRPDSIVVTREFARRRGLDVGGTVMLVTPSGRRPFTIRGLLDARGIARVYGGNLAVMDLFAAEATFTRPGLVNRLDVVVDRDADVAR